MKSAIPMLLILATIPRSALTNEESSDSYLRNVVEELQMLNGVVAPSEKTSVSRLSSFSSSNANEDAQPEASVEATASDVVASYRHVPPQHYQTISKNPTYLLEPPPAQQSSPQAQPQSAPMMLGFTAAELAAMYRKAMERGVPVKHHQHQPQQHYNPLPEYSVDRPKVVPALRVQQPTGYGSDYAYYFYPLHTFRHELEKQNSVFHPASVTEYFHTLPDAAYAATTMLDPSKKEGGTSIMQNIITGVSSFIGMAIFFVLSMFVYPRVLHMSHFPFVTAARGNFGSEIGHLAAFVAEAIDSYNKNTRQKSKQLPQR